MKILVFSDTHLTHKFEQDKFDFLVGLIKNVDKVVINGDFWDGYYTRFERFLNSEWKGLFPLLKEKNAVLVLGNHDNMRFSDDRINDIFSEITEEYRFSSGNKQFITQHGDIMTGHFDSKFSMPEPVEWFIRFVSRFFLKFEEIGTKLFGKPFYYTYRMLYFIPVNNIYKKYARTKLKDNEVLIAGHTHLPENKPEERFINSGFIRYGLATYVIIEDGSIEFVETKY